MRQTMALEQDNMHEVGERIMMDDLGVLQVPAQPMILLKEAQDIESWATLQTVFDTTVEKSYAGARSLVWVSASTLTDASMVAQDYPVIFDMKDQTAASSSCLFSGTMLFHHLGWFEAADLLHQAIYAVIKTNVVPVDALLSGEAAKQLSTDEFYAAVIAAMHNDAEANQYDELASKFHELFDAGAEKTSDFSHVAMEKARKQLTVAGHFTEEQGQKLKTFLANDFSRLTKGVKAGAKEKLNPSRLGAGILSSAAKLLHKTGVALSGFADKADDALACKSGEVTSAGKLKCHACGYEMNFKKTGRIPPCPKCHKTEFTKGY